MTEENEINYPSIGQSWGIAGIAILSMLLFSPLNIFLNDLAGKEASFLVYYLFAMGATFWIAHHKRKQWTNERGFNFEFGSGKLVLLVCIAMIGIQAGIIIPIADLMPMPEFIKKIFLEFSQRNGVFSFISIVIAAPILEELIFRGIILDGLLKRYAPLKSIVISSVLFGVVHLNPWQFVTALIIGVFSGWVYYKTRRLSLSILIHAVNNLLAFSSMYFMDAETMMDMSLAELYGGSLNLVIITAGAILVAGLCLFLLKAEFRKTAPSYDHTQIPV